MIDRLLILEDPWTDRGLFHLIVDETDQIVDWSKEEDDTPSDPDLSNNTTWELNQFFQKYPEKLIITKVYIGRLASPSDVEVIDTRIRGGGIKEEYDLGLLSGKFPEITWVADFGRWDGKPYPGQGTLLVEIPESLTKAGGGELEDSDIRTVVEKHMAAGIYPIIQYYGSRPTIQKAWGEKFGDNAKLNLEWDSVETAQSYNVYNIKNDGSRTLIGDTENTFLYDALTPTVTGDIYVVQIFPVHDDEEGLGSDRISIKAG